jgi:membrane protein
VFIGAAVTAVLFSVVKFALTYYLGNSDFASQFGSAAASLAALLVWVYYLSIILLYGAEFTQVWAKRYGGGIQPEPGAVHVVERTEKVEASPA